MSGAAEKTMVQQELARQTKERGLMQRQPAQCHPEQCHPEQCHPEQCHPEQRRRSLWDGREQDSCGIGFIAEVESRGGRRVLDLALDALSNLAHRGAVAADGRTSDGIGVQTQLPRRFLLDELARLEGDVARTAAERALAVGMFFLPHASSSASDDVRERVARSVARCGLRLVGWRPVPTRPEILGDEARATRPDIVQALLAPQPEHEPDLTHAEGADAYERCLYRARRRLERELADLDGFYIASLSHRTLVYKSMAPAAELAVFFPDLLEPAYDTSIALFHQRFSTNTSPAWHLAQPFRWLAHNGEINTVQGNIAWMRARESQLESALMPWLGEVLPVLDERASDSAVLDQMLELLVLGGRDPLHALAMLMPAASRQRSEKDDALRAFYDYHAMLAEPWDGPAAVVLTDGRIAAAGLDRNGLRPQRYWRTADGLLILGSEAGMVEVDGVVARGRLGPGQTLAVDTVTGRIDGDAEIKQRLATARPYRQWIDTQSVEPPSRAVARTDFADDLAHSSLEVDSARQRQAAFGYSKDTLTSIFDPMLLEGKPPVGSMGNDAPHAVLSTKPQLLYSYFKQRFAQVTNPPIDPLRERLVFSLDTFVGGWANLLDEHPEAAHLVRFGTPILSSEHFAWLRRLGDDDPAFRRADLRALFPVAAGAPALEAAVERLCARAEAAVDDGAALLVLSDRGVDSERAPVPMLLAVSAVHQHLVRRHKRMRVSLVADTGEPREDHHMACLLGYGATLVHPYLAFDTVVRRAAEHDVETDEAMRRYLQALEQGLLKIMSRLGVCPMASYHGAQLFEALGLDEDLVERYFTGTPSRVGGVGPKVIAGDVLARHREAFGGEPELVERGYFRFRKGGEVHGFAPPVFKSLHKAVRTGSTEAFARYSREVDGGPATRLRNLLAQRPAETPTPLDEVESAAEIARRFCGAAMSLGALSREAHEVVAIGMNRLGARSNSGEGGEDPRRFDRYGESEEGFLGAYQTQAGDLARSAIKQIASGRFGVQPHYLVSADELEIKMAQGSKPGEGGQIPGHKVTPEIARLRSSVPGVALISPPPHHDIYSIEDLAQLIHDLKRVNPRARVGVKLVSLAGVGTIACGVVKAGADYVQISGDDGGTGASPLGSIKHAGMPWELGLAETQQALVANDLRGRVTLRVDGGLKTGRDVVLGALLGAEEYGFGTAPLLAIGCVMARQCHLNTCPVGVATQREALRERFPGTPEHIVSFMLFVAEEVRHHLARLGARSVDEIVGRLDLLETAEERAPVVGLALDRLLFDPDPDGARAHRFVERVPTPVGRLDERLWRDAKGAVHGGRAIRLAYEITNRDRSVGARLAGEIAEASGGAGCPDGTVEVDLRGVAGQSFGVWLAPGVTLRLVGEANDYVGKGLAGGRLVLRPESYQLDASRAVNPGAEGVVAGNTLLYGATAGELFAAGRVGERFCVRNSGATAVVEGCGDHGCEYMTAGTAVVLGAVGRNFGAGMSGGIAYVWDPERLVARRLNDEMVREEHLDDADRATLRRLLEDHVGHTESPRALEILETWPASADAFRRVVPRTHPRHPEVETLDVAADSEQALEL
ncbi:MAG: glutamate synthase large subunit [Acidobacteriota bacterium]